MNQHELLPIDYNCYTYRDIGINADIEFLSLIKVFCSCGLHRLVESKLERHVSIGIIEYFDIIFHLDDLRRVYLDGMPIRLQVYPGTVDF